MNADADSSTVRDFTRGGQIILHNIRMANQILTRAMGLCLLVMVASSSGVYWLLSSAYERYMLLNFLFAKAQIFLNSRAMTDFTNPDGSKVHVYASQIIDSPLSRQAIRCFTHHAIWSLSIGLLFTVILAGIGWWSLTVAGMRQKAKTLIRGETLENPDLVASMVRQGKVSSLNLAGLPLPEGFETKHMLVHGTTGTGKSVCIRGFLDQIRERGDRVIIYDRGGDYSSRYLIPDQDILMNPMSDHSAAWSLWNECSHPADFTSLAAALLPMPPGINDPFWITGARAVLAEATRMMGEFETQSQEDLLALLLSAETRQLEDFFKNTPVANLISTRMEKTSLSIMSVLAAGLQSLKYLKPCERNEGFSIRQWVQNADSKSWVFLTSVSEHHEVMKPLISAWLDIAVRALLSASPSTDRRLWFILDELPSLERVPCLSEGLAESRKFGGCFLLAMQSMAQLKKIYGSNGAQELSDLCNTRIFFRDPSFETAQWASRELGEVETEENRENISYSESAMRSGVSISGQRYQRQVISPTEIMKLRDLEAFVRLSGIFPLTRVQFYY